MANIFTLLQSTEWSHQLLLADAKIMVARQVFFPGLSWDMNVRHEWLFFLNVIAHSILERWEVDFNCFLVDGGEKDLSQTAPACSWKFGILSASWEINVLRVV